MSVCHQNRVIRKASFKGKKKLARAEGRGWELLYIDSLPPFLSPVSVNFFLASRSSVVQLSVLLYQSSFASVSVSEIQREL